MRYADWGTVGGTRFSEQIARTRLLEEARRVVGASSLPESGSIDAALAEVIAQSTNRRSIWSYSSNGVVDVQRAVDDSAQGDVIDFGNATPAIFTTIHIRDRAIAFIGAGYSQSGLQYFGTGACIEVGDDDGLAWDTPSYDGTGAAFAFVGMSLRCMATNTPLANGLGSYGAGTYGIREWRGGSVLMSRVSLRGWEYAFWGVQSDINRFSDLAINENHVVFYLGARSDQARIDHIWTNHNDIVFLFEGSKGHLISHWISDSDGSATTNPAIIRNSSPARNVRYATTRITSGIVFDTPWLESLAGGSTSFSVEAFIEVGIGDTVRSGVVTIRNPIVLVELYSTPAVQHTLYLVTADQAYGVVVEGMAGAPGSIPWNNLRSVFKIANAGAATNVPELWFSDHETWSGRLVENYSVTSVTAHIDASNITNYTNNVVGGTGAVHMGQLGLQRRLQHNSVAISSGTTSAGDMVLNRNWALGGVWAWISGGGSPGTQHPIVLPSASADRGDTSQTLVVGTDHMYQRWATALTANRTVTLSTTGATNGSRFKVVRTGLGAFTLDVGGLKTIPSATAASVEVMYDGGAWRLVGYELL